MPLLLIRNWWAMLFRGLAALTLGLLLMFMREITRSEIVPMFGAYALLDGLAGLATALRAAERCERWHALFLEGAAGVAAAAILFVFPAISAFSLIRLVAIWALATGVAELFASSRLRKHIPGEPLLALSGFASLGLGGLLLLAPAATLHNAPSWIGVYAFVFGAFLIALGWKLRAAHLRIDVGESNSRRPRETEFVRRKDLRS